MDEGLNLLLRDVAATRSPLWHLRVLHDVNLALERRGRKRFLGALEDEH